MAIALSIALFGAAGCLVRYWLCGWINTTLRHNSFPYGTLVVNIVGAFLIGLLLEFSLRSTMVSHNLRVALSIGFIGGLTTFSTFSLETFTLLERGLLVTAFVNVFVSVSLCLLSTWVGILVARWC